MVENESVRIGLMGGSFNPIHMGHLVVAQESLTAFYLSKIIFVPAACSPLKRESFLATRQQRLEMVELSIADNPAFSVDDCELQRGGASYTVETLRHFKHLYPDAELYFIIGSDSLLDLHRWKAIEEILGLCRIVTAARPGVMGPDLIEKIKLPKPWPARLMQDFLNMHAMDLSSTDIRMRVAEGLSVRYLVPPEVDMYISEHNLYG